jgi:glutamine cyclotransferase
MVAAETGEIKKMSLLPGGWFGEGVTVLGDKVIQLTWRSKVGIVYDKKTFRRLKTFNYNHEGWGITYDGRHLIVSDGSNVLRFWDPRDFQEVSRRPVMEGETPVYGLNELEFIDGYIFANVWPTDRIVRIDPASGKVVGEIDVCPLLSLINKKKVDVTNGIAYDPKTKRVFVTGKYWPRVFVLFIKNSEAR